MTPVFPKKDLKISLAVSFDDRMEELLRTAESLALATGARLRLVHVCDPWTRSFLATAVEGGGQDLLQTLKEEAIRVAEKRLQALARTLDHGLTIETEVLTGEVVNSLSSDAEANETSLIIVGASKGGAAGTSLGFSTAVSLITESLVPVMVVNEDAGFRAAKDGLRLLVADDFSDVARNALEAASSLAAMVSGSSLLHVHVESYAELTTLKDKSRGPEVISREQIEFLHRKSEEEMMKRAGDWPGILETAGSLYRQELVAGPVIDELNKSAVASRSNVAVFGQHRVFHRKAMHVGKVPFKAMLSQNRAVIVVPVG